MRIISRIVLLYLLLLLLPNIAGAQESQVSQPYWHYESGAPASAVATGDLDGDGLPEVVLGTADGQLNGVDNNGELLWQVQLDGPISAIVYKPAEENIAGGLIAASTDGTVLELDNNGKARWQHQVPGGSTFVGGLGPFLLPAVAVGDVDGDGASEIVVAGNDDRISLIGGDGQLRWTYDVGHSLVSVATVDLDGDGRAEIVPGPLRGGELQTLDGDGTPIWRVATAAEVGLVQTGDTDGDGLAEIILLTAAWDLYAYEGDGRVAWHNDDVAITSSHSNPQPGQMLTSDLDGDGRVEILVAAPLGTNPGVYAFAGDGRQRWRHTSPMTGLATTFFAGKVTGADKGGVLVAESVQGPVLLLNQDGQRIARYDLEKLTGALEMRDLDGNGWTELIVGTEGGLQAFGATNHGQRRQLWQRSLDGPAVGMILADLNGDGERVVVVGTRSGRVYAFDGRGQVVSDVALGAPVLSLVSGETDGDGREEVVVSTWNGSDNSQIHLLDSSRRLWSIPAGQPVTALAIEEEEILTGGGNQKGGFVARLDSLGETSWRQILPERVTAIGLDDGQLLAGVQGGAIYLVNADQAISTAYTLDGPVAAVGQGFAVTAGGRLYRLVRDYAAPVTLGGSQPLAVQIGPSQEVFLLADGQITELLSGDLLLQEVTQERPKAMVVGSLRQGSPAVIAIGSERGRLHFYGWASNQPPLLTDPGLTETRAGYAYSIDVNDPDGDTVTVGLAVWDPSADRWLEQLVQPLARGQGRLSWEVPAPFDTWDAGRDSQYRFTYDDGLTNGLTMPFEGPASIAVDPWYLFYGRYALGALLVTLTFSTVLLFLRRDRAHRRSPLGQAESALTELAADRNRTLPRLSELASDPQWTETILPHLPGLVRATEDAALGDLVEGYHRMSNYPDFLVEGLEAVLSSLEADQALDPSGQAGDFYRICHRALKAQSVDDVAGLGQEFEAAKELGRPAPFLDVAWQSLSGLGEAFQMLHNYQRVGASEDKVAYLVQAIELLGRSTRKGKTSVTNVEGRMVEALREHWFTLAAQALRQLQGQAHLEISLRNNEAAATDEVCLLLDILNEGRGPAYNINLEAREGPGFTVNLVGDSIDQLPAGGQAQVELAVRPVTPGQRDELRISLCVHYDDRERTGKTRYFSDKVRLIEVPDRFNYIPNPYAPGKPLRSGSPVFFGRDDIFTFVEDNLGRRGAENIIVLAGQRRMGKTSILRQITGRLDPAQYTPVFLDGQALGFEGGLAGLFYDIAVEIEAALAGQGIAIEAPSLAQLESNATTAFEKEFLPLVSKVLGQRILVLLLDEFEELEMRVRAGELPRSIFPYLRHLMQHSDQIAFILAGSHRLEELAADYRSALFNIALYKRVSFLDEGAARHLILEPVRPYGLLYDELAVDKMLRVTACHPYFLQLMCYALVGFHNREKVNYLSGQDVSQAMEQVVELGEGHLSLLWADCSLEEQSVLIALSRLLDSDWAADSESIAAQLISDGYSTDPAQVTKIMKELAGREIIRPVGGEPIAYEYKVDLVRLWVECYRPEVVRPRQLHR